MKSSTLLFLCFSFCLQMVSQELKLGNVTVEELQKTHSDIEPDAAAEYVFKKGTYDVGIDKFGYFYVKVKVDVKIKIYSKEGYEWANHQFPVLTDGKEVQTVYKDAFTYNLVDGQIEKTKLEKDGEFIEKVNEDFGIMNIMMPNVKVGSIIEFSYDYSSYNHKSLPKWFFQFKIPIQRCELSIKIPEYHQYNIRLLPYLDIKSEDKFGKSSKGYNEVETKYFVQNAPSFKYDVYTPNIENYIPSVKYELSTFRSPYSGDVIVLDKTWDAIAKGIYNSDYFGKELNLKGYFEKDLKKFITECTQNYTKVEAIYNFVKLRMNWNGYNGKLVDSGVKKAYKERSGNAADINLMLVAMFRSQGIKANPIIVSTRSNGVAFYPNYSAYNYVIAGVETDKGVFLYDATSKNAAAQIIPIRALNGFGRIVYDNGLSAEVNMMPENLSKLSINAMLEIKNDGSVSGKYREQMNDYNAFLYRENFGSLSVEDNIQRIEKEYNNIVVEKIGLQNIKDVSQPIIEEITFSKSNAVDIMSQKIYFSPLFMFGIEKNPFIFEKRDFPIDFVFPTEKKHMISIKIPAGYEVESIPESTVLEFEDNILTFSYQIKNINNSIQVSQIFRINAAIISADYYNAVKDFFTKMVEKNKEQVVLKKI
uniref:transglutaminase-like domain-containing protein n=2 Tax=Flavobacterium sp. TaxID=239 RepID=UPI00404925A8